MIGYVVRCVISTSWLKIILFLNEVDFCGDIKSSGGYCPQIRISKSAHNVAFGHNVVFNNYNDAGWNSKCAIWVREGATLCIGNNAGLNGVLVYASNSVHIGDNVCVGGGTRIMDTDFHPLDYNARKNGIEGTYSAPIVIENDVFVGTECLILKGVTIGARSIVAAGSVVTKNIPSDEVWGGNPAHFIRSLNKA